MRAVTIARNYAEALFEIGERTGQTELFADLLDGVASAFKDSARIREVLLSPRVPKSEKVRLVGAALSDSPGEFARFVQAVVKRGRQVLFPEIAASYFELLDVKLNRVQASVTVARAPSEALKKSVEENLERIMGKDIVATYHIDPAMLGGAVIRVGERVFDGSLRRKMTRLRRQLLSH